MSSNISEGNPQDFWELDGISLVGNPNAAPDTLTFLGGRESDTISFKSSHVPGGLGDDHISLNLEIPTSIPNFGNPSGFWKYEEDKTLNEIKEYLSGTYQSHYTSQESKTQTLDLIESIGDGEAFCRSNAIKYLSRFGKKGGKSKLDILKAIHYCILLYHFSGLHSQKSNYNY